MNYDITNATSLDQKVARINATKAELALVRMFKDRASITARIATISQSTDQGILLAIELKDQLIHITSVLPKYLIDLNEFRTELNMMPYRAYGI